MYRSAPQFRSRYQLFVDEAEDDVEEKDVVECEEVWSGVTTVLEVEGKVLHRFSAPELYRSYSQVKCLQRVSGEEYVIHFYRNSLPDGEIIGFVLIVYHKKNQSKFQMYHELSLENLEVKIISFYSIINEKY